LQKQASSNPPLHELVGTSNADLEQVSSLKCIEPLRLLSREPRSCDRPSMHIAETRRNLTESHPSGGRFRSYWQSVSVE
jgi:hypothetical protein